jgi:dienelactone hydrolase
MARTSRSGLPPVFPTVLMLAAVLTVAAAAQNAPSAADGTERIRPVTPNLTGEPPTGPHAVVVEHDQALATHTIYRPATLGSTRHPVLVWGNGGCAKNGLMFAEFLTEIASHGFVIIADGPPAAGGPPAPRGGGAPGRGGAAAGAGAAREGGPAAPRAGGGAPGGGRGGAAMTDGTPLIAAIDWLAREEADRSSRFYQRVDTARVAAMGMSCGGLMSYGASADPRVATVGIWNSGLFQPDAQIFAGLHSPVIIVTGGESDIAYPNGKRDFETMPANIPVFYGVYPSIGHGGTYNEDNGGAFGVAAVAWLKWQLMNDTTATGRGYFAGDACTLCRDPQWQVASRGLR